MENYATISADELFFNGKMIPSNTKKTTLGDVLLVGDDGILSSKMGKGTSWWKQRLGLKRSQGVVPMKGERNIGGLEKIDEMKTSGMVFERCSVPSTRMSRSCWFFQDAWLLCKYQNHVTRLLEPNP
ncbi:hypothetical protein ACS0TY_023620 [Phlomoides rotata]